MGLLLEIVLILGAWKRGWKAWALFPFGMAFAMGFVGGYIQGFSGVVFEGWETLCVLIDLIAFAALIVMNITGHKSLESDVTAGENSDPVTAQVVQHG